MNPIIQQRLINIQEVNKYLNSFDGVSYW